jgi:hypothetical protein
MFSRDLPFEAGEPSHQHEPRRDGVQAGLILPGQSQKYLFSAVPVVVFGNLDPDSVHQNDVLL